MLSTGENLETAVNVDEVLRYFTVQVFAMNWDSYLGHTGHNYFLYEEDGVLHILPWDYNLAFGTYALGMTDPIQDPNTLINWPVNTPGRGETMRNRPLYHNLMKNDAYFGQYHAYFHQLLSEYWESGHGRGSPPPDPGHDRPLCGGRPHCLLLLCRPPAGGGHPAGGMPPAGGEHTGAAGGGLSHHPWPSRRSVRGWVWTPLP